jgi:phosphoribosylformylglycinamidine synthase subunit PurSL
MPHSLVHRIEVRPKPGSPDPRGAAALREAQSLAIDQPPTQIEAANIYLLEGDLDRDQVEQLANELLADSVTETATIGAAPSKAGTMIEVHPLPGVMDPDADAVKLAIKSMLGVDVDVRTGRRFDMHGTTPDSARQIAEQSLANTVIHAIHDEPYLPESFPHGTKYELKIVTVPLRGLDDPALMKMSREAHLFLSLDEMKAVQAYYSDLGRDPREIELETLAQTWSEHCVHKTMKATIRYREMMDDSIQSPRIAIPGIRRPNHTENPDGSITIHNLLKSTVAAATHKLMSDGIDWCLSIFVDNAGVIAFDDEHAVCFKVETHNHPSAIEPYGGAATGIGGCIRDIIGTGLAARPIASTDVFCVAYPNHWTKQFTAELAEDAEKFLGSDLETHKPVQQSKSPQPNHSSAHSASSVVNSLPAGVLPPRRVLTQIVAGVRDYGNRMGIPTLNGAVWFDDDYIGNPLVYCGVIGVMPRDKIKGQPQRGDRIIAIGGRTGRDGIHGATFSSAELTDTHADEFSHAVQIGNAVTEKVMMDAILEARDWRGYPGSPSREHSDSGGHLRSASIQHGPDSEYRGTNCLYSAITDCGAGGFSSAVGEMGRDLGAQVHLDRAPLKYSGLSPTEIWISEAQERMVLSVPLQNVETLQAICDKHGVEMCDLGEFGTESGELVLNYAGTEVGRMSMEFLHDGLPETVREAVWKPVQIAARGKISGGAKPQAADVSDSLLALLAHPNIASKKWIIRQYDHEVQGRTVVKPLTVNRSSDGARREGPSDGAVITPVYGSSQGLAIANGLATGWRDDPYVMALAAIDECVRNLVCVGADASRIAILDNFCWPSCNDPENLGALVRAAEGCYDGAIAYRTPFISGKDSLNNQFTTEDGRTIKIPPTLLISGMGIVPDVNRSMTMDAKAAGNLLLLVGRTTAEMGGSHYEMIRSENGASGLPRVDLKSGPRTASAVSRAIQTGLVRSAHDCSEGGLLVAASEMAFAGGLGLRLDLTLMHTRGELDVHQRCFAETPSRYLLEVERGDLDAIDRELKGIPYAIIGEFDRTGQLRLAAADVDFSIDELHAAWSTSPA